MKSAKIYKFLTSVILFLLSSGSDARELKPLGFRSLGIVYFTVLDVEGNVQFAKPLSVEWRPARVGQIIPDGSILRVEEKSRISIEAQDNLKRLGLGIKKTQVTIRAPIILRLGRESFRRISVDPKMLSQFASKIRRSSDENEFVLKKMSDAWRQMAALLSPETGFDEKILKEIVKAMNKSKDDEDVGISVTQGKIDFVTPTNNQLLLTDKMPAGVKIMWQRDKAPPMDLMKYDLYFWKQGQPKTKYGVATGNKYSVVVEKPGKYFMQVQSSDGSFKSKVRVVQVELAKDVLKDRARYSDKSRDEAIKATLSRRIRAVRPDRNLVWYGNGNWPIFEFEWTRPEACEHNVLYEFIVTDNESKEFYKRTVNSQKHQWRPPKNYYGKLYWETKVIGCRNSDKIDVRLEVNTIPRKLELAKVDSGKSALSKLKEPRYNGTLFFSTF